MKSGAVSAKPRGADSPASRYIKAALIALAVAGACALFVKLTAKKVRDLTPDELRAKMGAGEITVDSAITQLNRLDLSDRQSLTQSPEWREFVRQLPPPEVRRLVLGTLDKGITLQLERFHRMKPEERKQFIEDARTAQAEQLERFRQLPKEEQDKRRAQLENINIEEMIDKGVKAYLSVTTSEERAELAPLYEERLNAIKFIRGR